jgi:hypothetical protein
VKGPLYPAQERISLWAITLEVNNCIIVVAAETPKKVLYQARKLTHGALDYEPEAIFITKKPL